MADNPMAIAESWSNAELLFSFCGTGCLTIIKGNKDYEAYTHELTKAIHADDRIPKNFADIMVEDLPVFAEWQRKIDAEFPEERGGR